MKVRVENNFYHPGLVFDAIDLAEASRFRYFWGDVENQFYWNLPVNGFDSRRELIDTISGGVGETLQGEWVGKPGEFRQRAFYLLWEQFQERFQVQAEPSSCYINLMTFAAEGFPHLDSTEPETTVITYLTRGWDIRWGGGTAFYTTSGSPETWGLNAEIGMTVKPAFNRVVAFDSRILHGVMPMSRTFLGARLTLMFKIPMAFEEIFGTEESNANEG
jgi:hypothetical protein